MKVGVVGASGNLGTLLAESLSLAGHSISRFSHRADDDIQTVDVLKDNPDSVIAGLDAIVYCAWATRDRSSDAQMRHGGAVAIWAERCAARGCRLVFTSTVLATADSLSIYGRHKYDAEQAVLDNAGLVLRIGLVADDALPLILTAIRKRCAQFPSAARLLDWPVFPISSTAFAAAVEAELLAHLIPARLVWVAPREPTSLAEVAMWRQRAPLPSKLGQQLIDRVSRIPFRAGRVGRLIDGLAGLTTGPGLADPVADVPLGEHISTTGWQDNLRPYG